MSMLAADSSDSGRAGYRRVDFDHPRHMDNVGQPAAGDSPPGSQQRNAEMVRRYEAGETLESIGASLGLTRERVRQIVRLSGAEMPRETTCAVGGCYTAPRRPRIYCYAHQLRFELFSATPLAPRRLLRSSETSTAHTPPTGTAAVAAISAERRVPIDVENSFTERIRDGDTCHSRRETIDLSSTVDRRGPAPTEMRPILPD